MAERTIVLDGFSKTYAMTGWRLGYAVVPPSLVQTYSQLIINTISCAPTFVQVGAVEALTGPQDDVEAMVVEFKARRDLVVAGLNDIPGIRCATPVGAFYVFPEISGTGLDGADPGRAAAPRGGRVRAGGDRVRGRRDRAHPGQLRELAREPDRGAGADPALRRRSRPCLTRAARPRVFVARLIPEEGLAPIRDACDADIWTEELPPPRAELLRRGRGCDGLLTLLTDRVDDELLDIVGPGLKVVSNFAVGYDNIDVAACARRGRARSGTRPAC